MLLSLASGNSCLNAGVLRFTGIQRDTNGVVLRWSGEAGSRYEVQSADLATGPWRARAAADGVDGAMEWADLDVRPSPQQYYRLSATASPDLGFPSGALFSGDFIPRGAALLGEQAGELAANGAFLASQLGAGGLQLLTTGT